MNDNENTEELVAPDELASLKARADLMGVDYHPSIGLEKLRAKVVAAMSDKEPAAKETKSHKQDDAPAEESEGAIRFRKRREANELVRIRVACMNPAKKEWEGELFTAGNSLVGSFTKFVPFNVEDGWHVPRIIYNQMVQRQCQIFFSSRDSRGNTIREGKLIKEFVIEVLPNLTPEELAELARRQAMAKSVD